MAALFFVAGELRPQRSAGALRPIINRFVPIINKSFNTLNHSRFSGVRRRRDANCRRKVFNNDTRVAYTEYFS